MKFEDLVKRAVEIRGRYDASNKKAGREPWDAQAFMAGFVGDVGDLSKLIMAKQGLREIEGVDEKLAHELSDCLWSTMVLADNLGINLETAFTRTMDELAVRITQEAA